MALLLTACLGIFQALDTTEDSTHEVLESGSHDILFVPTSQSQDSKLKLLGGEYMSTNGLFSVISIEKRGARERTQILFLYDWTCAHCNTLHKKIHTLAGSTSNTTSVNVICLPVALSDEGEDIHKFMLSLLYEDPDLYTKISKEMLSGELLPEVTYLENRVLEFFSENLDWRKKHLRKVKAALHISRLQFEHNERALTTSTYPQLIGIHRILSGAPTTQAVVDFIEKESVQQREYYQMLIGAEDTIQGDSSVNTKIAPKKNSYEVNKSKIEFQEQIIVTEPINIGDEISGTYRFKNTGEETLSIYTIRTGCGCTKSKGWNKKIKPGETGQLTITYDSKGKPPRGTHIRIVHVVSSANNIQNISNGVKLELHVPIRDQ